MINKVNKTSSNNTKLEPFNGSERLLTYIYSDFTKDVKPLMVSFFDSIDDLLFEMAEKSSSAKNKKTYFDALKSIRINKLNVLSSFLSTIKQTFSLFEHKNFIYFEDKVIKVVKKRNSKTKTIDKNDIQEKFTQNSLIHSYEKKHKIHILAFNKRFSLLIAEEITSYDIPVGPYVIISAFAKSIRLLHLDLNIKLILYKHFEHIVLDNVGNTYQKINQYLNNNGVATGFENTIKIDEPPPEIEQTTINKDVETDNSQNYVKTPSQQQIIITLSEIQHKAFKDVAIYDSDMLSPVEIKNALLIQLKKINIDTKPFKLEQYDRDTINLTTMLFQLVDGDRNIPEAIKTIISKLQFPYIKATIQDSSLLSNKKHPAQILLELFSKTSVGWNTKLDTNNLFFDKVDEIVTIIIKKSNLDYSFFDEQLLNFQNFIKNKKNNFKKTQERAEIKIKGRERIVNAMSTVEAVISYKIENLTIPSLIKKMLLGPWKNLLTLLIVRHSNVSLKYLSKVTFIDEIINILQSKQHNPNIKNNINKLCVEYKEGLKLVAYNGKELEKRVEEFKQCLLEKYEQNKIKPTDTSKTKIKAYAVTSITEDIVYDSTKVASQESLMKSPDLSGLTPKERNLVETIQVGTWVAFERIGKEPVKAKLSWINPKSGKYIFVNDRGLKITDRKPQDLAKGLDNSSISLIQKD